MENNNTEINNMNDAMNETDECIEKLIPPELKRENYDYLPWHHSTFESWKNYVLSHGDKNGIVAGFGLNDWKIDYAYDYFDDLDMNIPPPQIKRVEQMKKIQKEALELFTKKNIDYGDAFAKYGVIGVLMRIEDKLQRSMSITKNGVNLINDEGIRDTLIDLHNYSAMALMLLDE